LEIVAPTLDINASTAVTIDTTTMTMTGSVNVVGDLDVDNLNINGNCDHFDEHGWEHRTDA
jgi:hypothetical protein